MLGLLGAAAALSIGQITESYRMAAWRDGATKLDKALADLIFAMFIMVIVTLAVWSGADRLDVHLLAIGIGGAVCFAVARRLRGAAPSAVEQALYAATADQGRAQIWLPRLWPFVYVLLWVGMLIDPPDAGWSDKYLLGQLVLLPALVWRLQPRGGLGVASPFWPWVLGLGLVVTVLLLT